MAHNAHPPESMSSCILTVAMQDKGSFPPDQEKKTSGRFYVRTTPCDVEGVNS